MRRRTFLAGTTAWAAGAGPEKASGPEQAIARRGKALVPIVTQPGATPAETYAAQELARWLKEATGATFPLPECADPKAVPPGALVVGPGPVAAALFPEVDLSRFGGEETIRRTRGGRLLLAGGRPRGTLYAVYRFLQDQVGIRWWTPWATDIPKQPNLKVAALDLRAAPAFESRDPFWYAAFDGDWAARNFSNSASAHLDARHGGKLVYKGFVHTFFPLVPPEKHFATHPEWYSLLDGKRRHEGAQLCTTNPELRDFLVERVRAWLKEAPDARIVSISQNDWYGACQCPACKAIDDAEGSHAGTVLALVNFVAEKLGAEFPEVAFDTLAYQYTRKAPRTAAPRPNVIVRLCSIECNFAESLEEKSNQAFADDIRAWSQKSQRLYIWDYTTDFAHYPLPHPNWFALGPNVRFFHRHGVRGLFEQGAYQSHGSEMPELRAWLLAQLLWDPSRDDRQLIDEFLDGYYGPAAGRRIRRYLETMHRAASGYHLGCFNGPGNSPFLKFAPLAEAERLWREAEQATADPQKRWRVSLGRQAVRYAFLVRWPQLRQECREAGGTWPLDDSRLAVARAWRDFVTAPGPAGWAPMTHVNEGGQTPAQFVERIEALERNAAAPPPSDIPGLDPKTAVTVGAVGGSLYQPGTLSDVVPDAAAAGGRAVRMPGTHHEWALQLRFTDLPEKVTTGRWRVYVVARTEKTAEAKPEETAFTAGVYDATAKMGRAEIAVRHADAAATYRAFLVGTIQAHLDLYLWAAPAAGTGLQALYIDRIVFVPG